MTDDGHTLTGDIRRHDAFPSALLGNRRDVLVYLPPGYSRSRLRYPVLYMQDGQNVFDAATSFAGVEWGVDETAQRLIEGRGAARGWLAGTGDSWWRNSNPSSTSATAPGARASTRGWAVRRSEGW